MWTSRVDRRTAGARTGSSLPSCAASSTITSLAPAVADDELALLGGARRVDRHGDAAGQQDRDVAQHPLEARLRQQRDAVARRDAQRNQAGGDLARERRRPPPRSSRPRPPSSLYRNATALAASRAPAPSTWRPRSWVRPSLSAAISAAFGTLAAGRPRAGAGTKIGGRREGGHALNSIKFRPWPRSLCHESRLFLTRALAIALCVAKHWVRWWIGLDWCCSVTFAGKARRQGVVRRRWSSICSASWAPPSSRSGRS